MKLKTLFFVCAMTATATSNAQPTAKEWNAGVVGWNLGNQLECSAPGQDGESMLIGMPDNSIKAETAWGNPYCYQENDEGCKRGWLQCSPYSCSMAVPHYQSYGDEY